MGYFVHKDDPFQRCANYTSKHTGHQIGNIAIFHAVRGYDERNQDPVQNLLRKVLDSGMANFERLQSHYKARVMTRMQNISKAQQSEKIKRVHNKMTVLKTRLISESQIATAQTALRQAKDRKDQWSIEAQTT